MKTAGEGKTGADGKPLYANCLKSHMVGLGFEPESVWVSLCAMPPSLSLSLFFFKGCTVGVWKFPR